MNPLEPPASFHLEAAQGWLDLGNPIEANQELEKITPIKRAHPDVLQMRVLVYLQARKWDMALLDQLLHRPYHAVIVEGPFDLPRLARDHAQALFRTETALLALSVHR